MKFLSHRFGGEGALIGGALSHTKITFVTIAVALSALARGGPLKLFAPNSASGCVGEILRMFLGVLA